ncbi:MAG TPA: DUF4157 domain-containing protein, partial [Ilumatobacteraceae bacterium]
MFEFDRLQRRALVEAVDEARVPSRRVLVQRKLVVGSATDPAEHEADRLADEALRRSVTDERGGGMGIAPASTTKIRRLATSVGAEGGDVDPDSARRIESARSGGAPLDERTRSTMESGFGADFSSVRVHVDGESNRLNHQLQSTAFTTGSDIFFRSGAYKPGSSDGQRLLAHELAHTVQQGAAGVQRRHVDDPHTIRRAFTVEAANWSEAKTIRFTGEGSANGVFFLKTAAEALVVKPALGGARSQLASEIMQDSGAHTVGMRTIALDSPEGKKLLKVMKSLASKAKKANKKGKVEDKITPAVNKLAAGDGYDSVTVMPAYENLSNMQELVSGSNFGGTFQLMLKNGFFAGLGKIHAADMLMGNEDRLGRLDDPSLKNTFVNTWSGQAVGLDLDLNAAGFDQVTGDVPNPDPEMAYQRNGSNLPSLAKNQYKDFVAYAIQGNTAQKEFTNKKGAVQTGRMGMRGGGMSAPDIGMAADTSKATKTFDDFMNALVSELKNQNNAADATALAKMDWSGPRAQFLTGVNDGMAALRKKMDSITARAGQLSAQHGQDSFLDPNVFKVRNMYGIMKRTMPNTEEPEIRRLLEEYAKILAKGG